MTYLQQALSCLKNKGPMTAYELEDHLHIGIHSTRDVIRHAMKRNLIYTYRVSKEQVGIDSIKKKNVSVYAIETGVSISASEPKKSVLQDPIQIALYKAFALARR